MIRCRCPWCGWRFEAKEPANLALFKTCPNPTLLPADVPAKGKRRCGGNLRGVVFTLNARGAWAAP